MSSSTPTLDPCRLSRLEGCCIVPRPGNYAQSHKRDGVAEYVSVMADGPRAYPCTLGSSNSCGARGPWRGPRPAGGCGLHRARGCGALTAAGEPVQATMAATSSSAIPAAGKDPARSRSAPSPNILTPEARATTDSTSESRLAPAGSRVQTPPLRLSPPQPNIVPSDDTDTGGR